MEKRILLQKHLKMLCETIGARPTGSTENKSAVDYVFGVFQKNGLKVYKQEFDCIKWVNSGASLIVDGKSVLVEPANYSAPCNVEAEFTCIDTEDKLRRVELANKIAVLYGDLCKEPLMPKNFEFYNPDEHKQIISLLEEKNPKAIITIGSSKDMTTPVIEDGDFNIPCAVVRHNALKIFLKSSIQKAKLTLTTMRIPTKAHNVIATYGEGHCKICFSAHIDTKPNTLGALDNASGVAVLLTLAASLRGEYPFQIEFVLLNGEDYFSTLGERAYMTKLSPKYCFRAVNVDGVGLKGNATSISFYECSKEIEEQILELVRVFT